MNRLPEEAWLSKSCNFINYQLSIIAIGKDYAGSVFIKTVYNKSNRYLCKSWTVLMTCSSSSCTYLDVISDSSGHSCIEFLERFILNLIHW